LAVLGRIDSSPAFVDEVRQRLRVHLFVGGQPKIAEYRGAGSLAAWVRVVALRLGQMLRRGARRHQGSEEAEDWQLAEASPEIDLLKRRYRQPFNDAVSAAVLALDARHRTVLRLHVLERVNIEKIGLIYGVHRATVATWIANARRAILGETRRLLMKGLQLDPSELDSLVGLLRSQLDLHLSQLLH
jgi:RNA polymerase sigma-70 factor (ECF subfamily)